MRKIVLILVSVTLLALMIWALMADIKYHRPVTPDPGFPVQTKW